MALINNIFPLPLGGAALNNNIQLIMTDLVNQLNTKIAATVASGTANRLAYYTSSTAIGALSAITASRALASDSNGLPVASTTTATELGYVNGVTSAIQTQFSGKASTALSNLASVAINTTLVSDTNNTDDLGSSGVRWKTGYFATSLDVAAASSGSNIQISADNTSNTASSSSVIQVVVGGASAGDPYFVSNVTGVTQFSWGIDNSDSDKWKLSMNATLGTNDAIVVSGTTGAVSILGTTTNDDAAAGFVGQYIESVVSSVNFPATTTWGDCTSISLTAGDWDVTAQGTASAAGATVTDWSTGISVTSGNSTSGLVVGSSRHVMRVMNATEGSFTCIANYRMTFTGTTTVYFKFQSTFITATPNLSGRLSARRVR